MTRFFQPALIGLLVLLAGACTGDGEAATGQLPDHFPARFPMPENAQVVSTGDVVLLRIADQPEEVANYYERALPAAGWDIIDRWQGTDPHGEPTFGLVVDQAGETGALSFTPTEDNGVLVRINLSQPTVTPFSP